jgi:hypothetical protein
MEGAAQNPGGHRPPGFFACADVVSERSKRTTGCPPAREFPPADLPEAECEVVGAKAPVALDAIQT